MLNNDFFFSNKRRILTSGEKEEKLNVYLYQWGFLISNARDFDLALGFYKWQTLVVLLCLTWTTDKNEFEPSFTEFLKVVFCMLL